MSTTYTNTFYLVRHGENPANVTKEFSYKLVDYSLNPKGVLQARQTAAHFQRAVTLSAVFASPLKRATQTGEMIARAQNLPVTVLEEFREVNVGDFELRAPTEENWRAHNEIFHQWFQGNPALAFPGGENFLELIERTKQGVLKAAGERSDQRILIAAHGGSLTALVYACCARDHGLITGLMANCSITEIELTTSQAEILAGTMRCWGSVEHLDGDAAHLVSPVLEFDRA